MAKKYLTLEEAASLAGISTDELRQLREKGELRGFADRGTWKFKQDDVEELARRRQADSHPDVPLLADDDVLAVGGSSVLRTDDDGVGEQPTVIRGSALDDDEPLGGTSDSDVRLILDDNLAADDDHGGGMASLADSDSDVRLAGDSGPSLLDEGSDSDVKLVGTDPDIPLLDEGGSDSDVRLVPQGSARNASESDIRLAPLDDDAPAPPPVPAAPAMDDDDGGLGLAAESGISLESLADSGISLESGDSGIALDSGDSGIALEGVESGISLGNLADSGISLADEDDDSITLAKEPPKAKQPPAKKGRNKPAPAARAAAADELDDTHLEVPAADDSEFELAMDEDEQADTSVILFDEEDEVDQHSATVVKKSRSPDLDVGEDDFDVEAGSAEFDAVDEFDDETVVAEDIVGEDDELEDIEAGDEDFGDEFASGGSQAEFVAPAGRMAAPIEQEWGTGTFVGLIAATTLMAVCGVAMFDLVRSMWAAHDPSAVNSAILDSLRGMF